MVGLTNKQIYREGFQGETIAACEAAFRSRPGVLLVGVPLDKQMQCGRIRVVGIPGTLYDELTQLAAALKAATKLRQLVAAL